MSALDDARRRFKQAIENKEIPEGSTFKSLNRKAGTIEYTTPTFEAGHIQLSPTEWISKREFATLTPDEQALLQEVGAEEFNRIQLERKEEWEGANVQLDNGDWVSAEIWATLTPDQQTELKEIGVDAFMAKQAEEEAAWDEAHVQLSDGQYVSKEDYNALSPDDQQLLMELGIDAFNAQKRQEQADWEDLNVQVSDTEWIPKEQWDALSPEDQAAIREMGVDAFIQQAEAAREAWEADNVQISDTEWVSREQWDKLTALQQEYLKEHGGAAFLAELDKDRAEWEAENVHLENTDEWVSRAEFDAMSADDQQKLTELGVDAFNAYVAQQRADWLANNVLVGPRPPNYNENTYDWWAEADWVSKEEYDAMDADHKAKLQELGVAGYNTWVEEQNKAWKAANVQVQGGFTSMMRALLQQLASVDGHKVNTADRDKVAEVLGLLGFSGTVDMSIFFSASLIKSGDVDQLVAEFQNKWDNLTTDQQSEILTMLGEPTQDGWIPKEDYDRIMNDPELRVSYTQGGWDALLLAMDAYYDKYRIPYTGKIKVGEEPPPDTYDLNAMLDDGLSRSLLLALGFNQTEVDKAIRNRDTLKPYKRENEDGTTGYDTVAMLVAGFTATDLRDLGFSDADIQSATDFRANNIQVSTGGWVDRVTYNNLTPAQQAQVMATGSYTATVPVKTEAQARDVFNQKKRDGEIPSDAVFQGFNPNTGVVQYTVPLHNDTEARAAFEAMKSKGSVPSYAVYDSFNAATQQINYHLPLCVWEVHDGGMEYDFLAATVEEANQLAAIMGYPQNARLWHTVDEMPEANKAENVGYAAFLTLKATGMIPMDAVMREYDLATGMVKFETKSGITPEQQAAITSMVNDGFAEPIAGQANHYSVRIRNDDGDLVDIRTVATAFPSLTTAQLFEMQVAMGNIGRYRIDPFRAFNDAVYAGTIPTDAEFISYDEATGTIFYSRPGLGQQAATVNNNPNIPAWVGPVAAFGSLVFTPEGGPLEIVLTPLQAAALAAAVIATGITIGGGWDDIGALIRGVTQEGAAKLADARDALNKVIQQIEAAIRANASPSVITNINTGGISLGQAVETVTQIPAVNAAAVSAVTDYAPFLLEQQAAFHSAAVPLQVGSTLLTTGVPMEMEVPTLQSTSVAPQTASSSNIPPTVAATALSAIDPVTTNSILAAVMLGPTGISIIDKGMIVDTLRATGITMLDKGIIEDILRKTGVDIVDRNQIIDTLVRTGIEMIDRGLIVDRTTPTGVDIVDKGIETIPDIPLNATDTILKSVVATVGAAVEQLTPDELAKLGNIAREYVSGQQLSSNELAKLSNIFGEYSTGTLGASKAARLLPEEVSYRRAEQTKVEQASQAAIQQAEIDKRIAAAWPAVKEKWVQQLSQAGGGILSSQATAALEQGVLTYMSDARVAIHAILDQLLDAGRITQAQRADYIQQVQSGQLSERALLLWLTQYFGSTQSAQSLANNLAPQRPPSMTKKQFVTGLTSALVSLWNMPNGETAPYITGTAEWATPSGDTMPTTFTVPTNMEQTLTDVAVQAALNAVSQSLTQGLTNTQALTAAKTAAKAAAQAAAQTVSATTVSTVTATKAAVRAAVKAAVNAATKALTRTSTQVQSVSAVHEAEQEAEGEAEAELTTTEKVKWPQLKGGTTDNKRPKLPSGSYTWRQGVVGWYSITPPFRTRKPIFSKLPPVGAVVGGRTPRETIQLIGKYGGKTPKVIHADIGVTDVYIKGGNKPTIDFKGGGLSTNVGTRIPSNTTGMALDDEPTGLREMTPKAVSRRSHAPKKRKSKRSWLDEVATLKGYRF